MMDHSESLPCQQAWGAAKTLLLGGQKSGKSRRAQNMAEQWLQGSNGHRAVLLATARALDGEMQARIDHHQAERQRLWPRLETAEVPWHLAQAVQHHSDAQTLLVIDCMGMWLTNWLMPPNAADSPALSEWPAQREALVQALNMAKGPVVMVSNEIGLGVIPMGATTRQFVDGLGLLNQQLAAVCDCVELMAAGLALPLKGKSAFERA